MSHLRYFGILACLAFSSVISPGDCAAEVTIAEPGPSRYAEQVLADEPIAYWNFEGKSPLQNQTGDDGFHSKVAGQVSTGVTGPEYLGSTNTSASFFGNGGRVVVQDPGDHSPLDFGNGDQITLEAWVNPQSISEGQQVYIVGKGRTSNPGFPKENQNYALRLRMDGGLARLSFLFRSQSKGDGSRNNYHRWNSNLGITPNSGWHHIAVTYQFGQPDSIRGYLDGQLVGGTWDYGGKTTKPPVVDNDELWIGSAMGGSANSTFRGQLDEIAIYRKTLSPAQISRRAWRVQILPKYVPRDIPEDGVLVEIVEGVPDQKAWPNPFPPALDAYTVPAFAFLEPARKYNQRGVQTDRTNPFVMIVSGKITLPNRECRLLLRARNGARLFLDGKLIGQAPFHTISSSAHGKIRHVEVIKDETIRPLGTGDNERVVEIVGDGQSHVLRLEMFLGGKKKRPELGETSVSLEGEDGIFRILSPLPEWRFALTNPGFFEFREQDRTYRQTLNAHRREVAGKKETEFWEKRHEQARAILAERSAIPVPTPKNSESIHNDIDRHINHHLEENELQPAALVDDWAFLRRVTLDVIGTVPTQELIDRYFAWPSETRREQYIDHLLEQDGWADHWVSYWQDVLAENPNIVNPTLNNTGPFRWWIYESFLDNKPFDRFATELIRMEGSTYYGGPGGFEMATQNDVPMAAKAHIIGQAFLALEMKCARCHDAPFHDFDQSDLFQVAAMLKRGPQAVPKSSLIPGTAEETASLLVTVTLKPGQKISPEWPFEELVPPASLPSKPKDSREQLATLVTSPENDRFAQVIVNRVWQRYMGYGLVEPVDDWQGESPSHPELLNDLARRFVQSGYDLKALARMILRSHTYQRVAQPNSQTDEQKALFIGPQRRRMSAEQIVDSLFAVCGKPFRAGELNIDADGSRNFTSSLNLGYPRRAWEFTSLSNERDRPSLSLPQAQGFLDVLESFGWRSSRQDPVSVREDAPTVLQPAVLANGVLGRRFTRCSEDSAWTELALKDQALESLVKNVIERSYSRPATKNEIELFRELLEDDYANRAKDIPLEERKILWLRNAGVSWSNHLSEESNRVKIALQEAVKQGDLPTKRLTEDWRLRYEDMLWAILNSPEFVFIP